MDFEKVFEEECEETFWDLVNFESTYLMKNNEEYKECSHKCAEIVGKYPKLQRVLEDDIPMALSKEEVANLIEYINNYNDRSLIEKKQLVSASCRNTYFAFKKLGLLKESNSD